MTDDTNRTNGIMAVTFAAAFLGTLVALCWPREPEEPRTDPKAVALAESLATARAEARHNLEAWRSALDSAPRYTVVRRVVRYIARHDPQAGADHVADSGKMIDSATHQDSLQVDPVDLVRWLAVSDSAQRVRGDSLEGEIVQRDFDVSQCREALEDATRPRPFAAFSAGFGAGLLVGFGGCVGVSR